MSRLRMDEKAFDALPRPYQEIVEFDRVSDAMADARGSVIPIGAAAAIRERRAERAKLNTPASKWGKVKATN